MLGCVKVKTTSDTTVYSGPCHVHFAYAKAGGTATTLLIRDGTDNTGPVVFDEDISANGSWTFGPFERGLTFNTGLRVDVDANIDFVVVGYTPA